MKICFCVDSMDAGGAERVVSILSNEFLRIGHEVTIIMVSSLKISSFYKLDSKVNLICLHDSIQKTRGIKRVRILRKTIKYCAPDVIVSFLPHINIYAHFAVKGLHIKHIVSERNNPYTDPKNFFFRLIKKIVFKQADGCVFQTRDAMHYYGNKVEKKSVVLPNPLNLSYVPKSYDFKRINEIIFVGSNKKEKNLQMAIDAFSDFLQKRPHYILRIFGSASKVSIKIGNKSLLKNVFFEGETTNWQEKSYQAKMFISTSDYEGMPNALLEAAALRIPCIATNCPIGGSREILKNGEKGILIPVKDKNALIDSMIKIADSEDLCKKYSDANINTANEYAKNKIAGDWISFIEAILSS